MSLLSTFTNASINGWRSIVGPTSYVQREALEPSTISSFYDFGYSCAISGDNNYYVVSNDFGSAVDAFYVFKNNNDGTWTEEAIITGAANQLAINSTGDYIVAGGPGAVRIYIRSGTTWTLQQTITGTTDFGRYCAIDSTGTRMATTNYTNNSGRGAAYVYKRTGTTWALEATLIATGAAVNDNNGFSVTMNDDGTYIATGAPNYGASNEGAIYVFTRSGTTWSQQQRLTGFSASSSTAGRTIAINGDGSYLMFSCANSVPAIAGFVHIYIRTGSTWTLQQTLSGLNVFGWALDINNSGDTVIINSIAYNSYQGIVHIYNRLGTSWALLQSVTTTPSQSNAGFTNRQGLSIDDSGSWFIGGATGMNTYGTASGTAFIFSNT